jgi:hypothetical protein
VIPLALHFGESSLEYFCPVSPALPKYILLPTYVFPVSPLALYSKTKMTDESHFRFCVCRARKNQPDEHKKLNVFFDERFSMNTVFDELFSMNTVFDERDRYIDTL